MKIILRKGQRPILAINLVMILIFSIIFIMRQNWEFILYTGVIILFFFLVLFTNQRMKYPNGLLWGLTLWACLHQAGGGIRINGERIYSKMLFTLSPTYEFIRYDQVVHLIGLGVATLLFYYLLKPLLNEHYPHHKVALSIVVIMGGLGIGALNEIAEFFITVLLPHNNGVGGYLNTSLDLIADLIGAIIVLIYILTKEGSKSP